MSSQPVPSEPNRKDSTSGNGGQRGNSFPSANGHYAPALVSPLLHRNHSKTKARTVALDNIDPTQSIKTCFIAPINRFFSTISEMSEDHIKPAIACYREMDKIVSDLTLSFTEKYTQLMSTIEKHLCNNNSDVKQKLKKSLAKINYALTLANDETENFSTMSESIERYQHLLSLGINDDLSLKLSEDNIQALLKIAADKGRNLDDVYSELKDTILQQVNNNALGFEYLLLKSLERTFEKAKSRLLDEVREISVKLHESVKASDLALQKRIEAFYSALQEKINSCDMVLQECTEVEYFSRDCAPFWNFLPEESKAFLLANNQYNHLATMAELKDQAKGILALQEKRRKLAEILEKFKDDQNIHEDDEKFVEQVVPLSFASKLAAAKKAEKDAYDSICTDFSNKINDVNTSLAKCKKNIKWVKDDIAHEEKQLLKELNLFKESVVTSRDAKAVNFKKQYGKTICHKVLDSFSKNTTDDVISEAAKGILDRIPYVRTWKSVREKYEGRKNTMRQYVDEMKSLHDLHEKLSEEKHAESCSSIDQNILNMAKEIKVDGDTKKIINKYLNEISGTQGILLLATRRKSEHLIQKNKLESTHESLSESLERLREFRNTCSNAEQPAVTTSVNAPPEHHH